MSTPTGSMPTRTGSTDSMSTSVSVVAGVSALILGVVVLVWPDTTLAVVAVLFGIQLVLVGILRIVIGAFGHDQEGWLRSVYVLTGVLVLLLGVACVRHPTVSLGVIVVLIGAGWLVEGVLQIVVGAQQESGQRWGRIVIGVLTVLAAAILLFAPVNSLVALTRLGGWLLLFLGVLALGSALRNRAGNGSTSDA
jgi:uncharacterized membrane protein HdeD (DUF308 family)